MAPTFCGLLTSAAFAAESTVALTYKSSPETGLWSDLVQWKTNQKNAGPKYELDIRESQASGEPWQIKGPSGNWGGKFHAGVVMKENKLQQIRVFTADKPFAEHVCGRESGDRRGRAAASAKAPSNLAAAQVDISGTEEGSTVTIVRAVGGLSSTVTVKRKGRAWHYKKDATSTKGIIVETNVPPELVPTKDATPERLDVPLIGLADTSNVWLHLHANLAGKIVHWKLQASNTTHLSHHEEKPGAGLIYKSQEQPGAVSNIGHVILAGDFQSRGFRSGKAFLMMESEKYRVAVEESVQDNSSAGDIKISIAKQGKKDVFALSKSQKNSLSKESKNFYTELEQSRGLLARLEMRWKDCTRCADASDTAMEGLHALVGVVLNLLAMRQGLFNDAFLITKAGWSIITLLRTEPWLEYEKLSTLKSELQTSLEYEKLSTLKSELQTSLKNGTLKSRV